MCYCLPRTYMVPMKDLFIQILYITTGFKRLIKKNLWLDPPMLAQRIPVYNSKFGRLYPTYCHTCTSRSRSIISRIDFGITSSGGGVYRNTSSIYKLHSVVTIVKALNSESESIFQISDITDLLTCEITLDLFVCFLLLTFEERSDSYTVNQYQRTS